MYIQLGTPKKLSALRVALQDAAHLKRNTQIAVIDDQAFPKAEALRNHKFNVVELGDIKSVDQVAAYPIVVCDIRGVGQALSSDLEGAHLISEIKKSYPDKFLVTYSGAQFDITYNESLRGVDASIAKDAPTEQWVSILERGLEKVTNPRERWIRLRRTLLDRGVEIHEVFSLEQRFIKAIEAKDASKLTTTGVPEEAKEIVAAFAKYALIQIIESLAS
ncbi:DNA-binding transcriptional response regulator [Marilutibacter alkalisoli]|uniref:Uncharacterized protein n=1 Tax=Marilutibacter alkalisoli TaxID=2591633 RepID=A0A514BQJ8_9GAMM|nr:hypothetical protein [Lysobacter alkalisoli]QDH69641.1 hypothetical protein FKV23_05705 [Lysobacter alkalisoli]